MNVEHISIIQWYNLKQLQVISSAKMKKRGWEHRFLLVGQGKSQENDIWAADEEREEVNYIKRIQNIF